MSKMTTILRLPSSPSHANSLLSRLYQSTPALLLPVIGLLMFLVIWNGVAKSIDTSLGQFPGPSQVFEQAGTLVDEHVAQRERQARSINAKRNEMQLVWRKTLLMSRRYETLPVHPLSSIKFGPASTPLWLDFLLHQ